MRGGRAFQVHAALAAVAVGVGGLLAEVVPESAEARLGAWVGVGLAALTGAVALVWKRWAVRRDLKAALKVVAGMFGLRALVVVAGLLGWAGRLGGAVGYIAGFFGVYVALQWIEVSYVMAASRDAAGGDE